MFGIVACETCRRSRDKTCIQVRAPSFFGHVLPVIELDGLPRRFGSAQLRAAERSDDCDHRDRQHNEFSQSSHLRRENAFEIVEDRSQRPLGATPDYTDDVEESKIGSAHRWPFHLAGRSGQGGGSMILARSRGIG